VVAFECPCHGGEFLQSDGVVVISVEVNENLNNGSLGVQNNSVSLTHLFMAEM